MRPPFFSEVKDFYQSSSILSVVIKELFVEMEKEMESRVSKELSNLWYWLFMPIFLMGIVSILASGGDSGGTRLSFVLMDDPQNQQPLSGVTVALYETDNVTIVSTKVSDEDGVVDFGDVGRDRATFTIAHQYDYDTSESTVTSRKIFSVIEAPTAEGIIFYLEGDDDTELGQINVTLTPETLPVESQYTRVDPLEDAYLFDLAMDDISVYEYDLQTDGYLSLLAMTYDETGSLLKWGMLLDQDFSNGATYDIGLTQNPGEIVWTTTPATPLETFFITADRQGVWYFLGFDFDLGSSGTATAPMQFPAEKYTVSGDVVVSTEMSLYSSKSYTTLPQSVEVPIPDYSFENVDFDTNAGILNWTLSGVSPRDLVSVNWVKEETAVSTDWSIAMAPDLVSWQVMNLPYPASEWLNVSSLETSQHAEIDIVDFDLVSGYDDYIEHLPDIFELSYTEFLSGTYEFIGSGSDSGFVSAKTATESVSSDTSLLPQQINPVVIKDRRRAGYPLFYQR